MCQLFPQSEGSLPMFDSLSRWLWGKEDHEDVPFEVKKYVRNEMEPFAIAEPEQMLPYPQL